MLRDHPGNGIRSRAHLHVRKKRRGCLFFFPYKGAKGARRALRVPPVIISSVSSPLEHISWHCWRATAVKGEREEGWTWTDRNAAQKVGTRRPRSTSRRPRLRSDPPSRAAHVDRPPASLSGARCHSMASRRRQRRVPRCAPGGDACMLLALS